MINQIKKVRKAVIPAAGLGTRFLPATKAIPKEMFPILDKPGIEYIIEEAVKSGIEEILIVVSSTKNSILDHFDRSYELEQRLLAKNKGSLYELVRKVPELVDVYFVRQKEPNGLGDAIYCAKSFAKDEPFAVLLPDDIIVSDKKEALAQCIEAYNQTGHLIVGVQEVKKENTKKYGILEPNGFNKENIVGVKSVVEKPDVNKAPSNLAILGRYVLTPDIFEAIENTKPDKSKEVQITDAILKIAKKNQVSGCVMQGTRYDTGSKEGFVFATVDMALRDPEISSTIKEYLKKICQ